MSFTRVPDGFMEGIFIAPHSFSDPENPQHGEYVNLQLRNDLYYSTLHEVGLCLPDFQRRVRPAAGEERVVGAGGGLPALFGRGGLGGQDSQRVQAEARADFGRTRREEGGDDRVPGVGGGLPQGEGETEVELSRARAAIRQRYLQNGDLPADGLENPQGPAHQLILHHLSSLSLLTLYTLHCIIFPTT
jgi:hypothetical protein